MTVSYIHASLYDKDVTELRRDPLIIGMAAALTAVDVPRDDLVTSNGDLRATFIYSANDEYAKHGGQYSPKALAAVGQAILSLLDRPATPEEIYHGVPDTYLQQVVPRLQKRLRDAGDPGAQSLLEEIQTELARRKAVGC